MSILLCGLDTETTGFRADKGDRIVEICMSLWDLETRKKVRHWDFRVNPLREIPAAASQVHGIYTQDLVDAPTWEKVAPAVNAILGKSTVMIAHNIKFDAPFIGAELLRVGQQPPDIKTFCTMENGRWATPNGKVPKLGELCWALEVEYDPLKAHSAGYDVDVMMQCLWKGMDRGLFQIPI